MSAGDHSCSRCANDSRNGGICTEASPLAACFDGHGDGWVEMKAPAAAQAAPGGANAEQSAPEAERDCETCAHQGTVAWGEPCAGCGIDCRNWARKAATLNDQPAPVANSHPAVWGLVMADMQSRDALGLRKYGVRLQPHNGRDFLLDAYAEILDMAVYLRGAIYERDGK